MPVAVPIVGNNKLNRLGYDGVIRRGKGGLGVEYGRTNARLGEWGF
jgi:hypothetical protein